MKPYVYIQAYFHSEEDKEEGLISFRHVMFEAPEGLDDVEIYDAGWAAMKIKRGFPSPILNDYIVPLQEANDRCSHPSED